MTDPTPLTPADADLQDFPFMPLHVARLRDSDLAAEAHPEGCWYAVLLWAASWHQLPAGSLPDNDAILTRLCGLGRDLRTFKRHKADALRGFVRCNDDRLYHPVVAEQVVAAWQSKIEQRHRAECARIKKANQRNGTDLEAPNFADFVAERFPASVPYLSLGTNNHVPRDEGSKRQRQGQGERQGDSIDDVESAGADADARANLDNPDDFPTDLLAITDLICRTGGIRHVDPGPVGRHVSLVKGWIEEGFDPETDILPAVRDAVTVATEPINALRYFERPIRQHQARRRAIENGSVTRGSGSRNRAAEIDVAARSLGFE